MMSVLRNREQDLVSKEVLTIIPANNTLKMEYKISQNLVKIGGITSGFFQLSSFDIAYRPEMSYARSQVETNLGSVDFQRVYMPVLVKMKLFPMIRFSIGPSLHYTFDEKFSLPEKFWKNRSFWLRFPVGFGS
jgi:hypothetical protein